MSYSPYISGRDISQMRREAKRLAREPNSGRHYMTGLDQIAQRYGLKHWGHVNECRTRSAHTEGLLETGLVMAFDPGRPLDKDFMNPDPENPLKQDRDLTFVAQRQIARAVVALRLGRTPGVSDSFSAQGGATWRSEQLDVVDVHLDEITGEYLIYRYEGDTPPRSVKEIADLVGQYDTSPPRFIWFEGRMYNLEDAQLYNRAYLSWIALEMLDTFYG